MRRVRSSFVVAAVAGPLVLAGCNGGDAPAAAPSASVPSSTVSTTSTTSTSSSTSAPSPTTQRRTAAELRRALLGLKDLPAGFEIEKDSSGGDEEGRASSSRPGCAALVRLLNASSLPGSLAGAAVSFSGGSEGPYIDESLDGFTSSAAAKAFVVSYRKAVGSCSTITFSVRGVGKSSLKVREVSFADLGGDSFAARFTAGAGALEGFELVQVSAQTGDVVVGMACIMTDPSDAEAATEDAVAKVESTLGTKKDV